MSLSSSERPKKEPGVGAAAPAPEMPPPPPHPPRSRPPPVDTKSSSDIDYYKKYLSGVGDTLMIYDVSDFYVMAVRYKDADALLVRDPELRVPPDNIIFDMMRYCIGGGIDNSSIGLITNDQLFDKLVTNRSDPSDPLHQYVVIATKKLKAIRDLKTPLKFMFVIYTMESNLLKSYRKKVAEYVQVVMTGLKQL